MKYNNRLFFLLVGTLLVSDEPITDKLCVVKRGKVLLNDQVFSEHQVTGKGIFINQSGREFLSVNGVLTAFGSRLDVTPINNLSGMSSLQSEALTAFSNKSKALVTLVHDAVQFLSDNTEEYAELLKVASVQRTDYALNTEQPSKQLLAFVGSTYFYLLCKQLGLNVTGMALTDFGDDEEGKLQLCATIVKVFESASAMQFFKHITEDVEPDVYNMTYDIDNTDTDVETPVTITASVTLNGEPAQALTEAVQFVSSDTNIATVSATNGVATVTPLNAGQVTINMSVNTPDGDLTDSVDLVISELE